MSHKKATPIQQYYYKSSLQVIIIRNYFGAFLWPRRKYRGNKSILDILKEKECVINVGTQTQGESVSLNLEGTSYFTHSEFVNETIWKFDISNKYS